MKSSVSHTLATHVEALFLTGKAAINATGNAGDNRITGNAAANMLDGGAGDDTLTGGGGNDTFVFTGTFGNDTVTDFHGGDGAGDVLHLSLGTAFDTFAEVIAAAHEVQGGTVLDFGSHGEVALNGVSLSKLAADDFMLS